MIAALSTEHFHLSSMDGRTKWAIEVNSDIKHFDSNQNALEGVQLINENANTLSASITIKLNWEAWRDRSLLETLCAWNWSFLLDLRVFFPLFFPLLRNRACQHVDVGCKPTVMAIWVYNLTTMKSIFCWHDQKRGIIFLNKLWNLKITECTVVCT